MLGSYVWPFKMDINQSFGELDVKVVEIIIIT